MIHGLVTNAVKTIKVQNMYHTMHVLVIKKYNIYNKSLEEKQGNSAKISSFYVSN